MPAPTVTCEQPGTSSDQHAPSPHTCGVEGADDMSPHAAWHGAETPDACFALVSRTPLGFYRWMDGHGAGAGATRTARAIAAETGCAPGIADLIDLLNALAAMDKRCGATARQAATWLGDHPDAGALERAARMLEVFEAACADPVPVRAFELRWGPFGHVGWLLRHADRYEALDAQGDDLLRRMGAPLLPRLDTDVTVAQIRAALSEARELYDEVRAAVEASPYLASVGITEPQTHLASRAQAARFSDEFYGIPVPEGYLDEMAAASRDDEIASEHALTALRGMHAARLNRAAALRAFAYARQLDHMADRWKPKPLEGVPVGAGRADAGHSTAALERTDAARTEAAHFATTLLYMALALVAACAWPYAADALEAQGRLFAEAELGLGLGLGAGLGAFPIPGILVQALRDLAPIGLISAASALMIRRLFELERHHGILERARQMREVADDLRADGAVLATGADAVEGRCVRIDVEEYLYDLMVEDAFADGVIDEAIDELVDFDCDDDGRDGGDGRDATHGNEHCGDGWFWCGAFWVGAAVCAASVGLAGIGSVPFIVAGLMGIEMPGLLAQAIYALLGVAAFVGVARVRPVQDPLTLALLACAPVLPYFVAVSLVMAIAAGLVCTALNRLFRLS